MFFARAAYVFTNNDWKPTPARGMNCKERDEIIDTPKTYVNLFDPTIASLLNACDVSMTFYAEGYDESAVNKNKLVDCFPDNYDASDVPFTYYAGTKDKPEFNKDLIDF